MREVEIIIGIKIGEVYNYSLHTHDTIFKKNQTTN